MVLDTNYPDDRREVDVADIDNVFVREYTKTFIDIFNIIILANGFNLNIVIVSTSMIYFP